MRKLEYRAVSSEEVTTEMKGLPAWTSSGDAISRMFSFEAYQEGLVFASAVGYVADHLDHHPDITIGYKTVLVKSSTHSTGGLSPYDFELAERIDGLVMGR
jgi:4a-hydroxytetrahydrobiopterin dehydratase